MIASQQVSVPRFRKLGVAALSLLVGVSACVEAGDTPRVDAQPADRPDTQNSIVDMAVVAGQFSALLRAVEAAGLTETLRTDGPFTVFAPTDGAFASLPAGTLDQLMDDREALADILLYHVVPEELTIREIRERSELETVQGGALQVSETPQGLTINGVHMLTTDVRAGNGIIHVMTSVLVPGSG